MGQKKEKKRRQITVFCAVVLHNGKILMLQRSEPELPDAHLKWEFPGGKPEFGETPEEAIRREVIEEAGFTVEPIRILPYVQNSLWEYEWGTQHVYCIIFLCKLTSGKQIPTNDHRVSQISWKSLNEIKKLDALPGTNEILDILVDEKLL